MKHPRDPSGEIGYRVLALSNLSCAVLFGVTLSSIGQYFGAVGWFVFAASLIVNEDSNRAYWEMASLAERCCDGWRDAIALADRKSAAGP